MNILRKTYKIETARFKDDVMNILIENIQPEEQVPLTTQVQLKKPFYGVVETESFRIAHDSLYFNLLVPIIDGKVSEKENSTLIELHMEMDRPSKVFFNTMLIFVSIFSLALVFLPLINRDIADKLHISLITMTTGYFVVGSIYFLCFLYQTLRCKRKLEKLFL